jgi:transposase
MSKPLSDDLRNRVIEAVEGGMTRRSAAERFGVAPSTAIRWVERWNKTGHCQAQPQGGDKRSHRIEALGPEILTLIDEAPDITLAEIADHLERDHGQRFGLSTIWRFFDRHAVTFKKNRARQRAATT